MKKLLLLCACLTFLASCNFQRDKEHTKNIYIHVNYKQKVNGYDVSAIIITDSVHEEYFADIVTREAMLIFKKDNQELTVLNPSYAAKNFIGYTESLRNGTTIEAEYIPFKLSEHNTFIGNQSPFFFFDVDFDGVNELIVCLWEEMGYRGHHAYYAYKINVGSGTHQLSPMQEAPFDVLDDYTEFDPIYKTISVPQGVDLKMEGKKVYGLVDDSFMLIERVQYDWEHTKGMKYELCEPTIYHYMIVDGKEILDKIERCPNDKRE